jgi:hypothetical protein
MSDPTQPVEGATTEAAPAETSGPDYGPVLDRMSELAGSIDTRFAALEGRIPEPQAEPEEDPWAALFGETEQPEPEYQQPPAPQLDINALQQAVQQQIQQAVTPYQQQIQQIQAAQAREQLLKDVPALQDPELAQQTIDGMVQSLQQAQASPDFIQWALSNPQQIKLHFEAAEARKQAAGQAPAASAVPGVESAGGAVPGGNGEQPNPVHEIFGAAAGGLPQGFR